MEFSQEQRDNLDVFMLNLNDTYSWGELNNKAMVGIPFWFKFQSLDEVPLGSLAYGRKGTAVVKTLNDEERSSEHARQGIVS